MVPTALQEACPHRDAGQWPRAQEVSKPAVRQARCGSSGAWVELSTEQSTDFGDNTAEIGCHAGSRGRFAGSVRVESANHWTSASRRRFDQHRQRHFTRTDLRIRRSTCRPSAGHPFQTLPGPARTAAACTLLARDRARPRNRVCELRAATARSSFQPLPRGTETLKGWACAFVMKNHDEQ